MEFKMKYLHVSHWKENKERFSQMEQKGKNPAREEVVDCVR